MNRGQMEENNDRLSQAYTFTTSSRRAVGMIASLTVLAFLSAGCSTARYQERPFFLEKKHGKHTVAKDSSTIWSNSIQAGSNFR